jgi:transmembrane sensor
MSDLDWDILTRYLVDACEPAERERVDRWLAESPTNRQTLDDLRTAAALADETAAPEREAAILASLRREWGAPAPATEPVRPKPRPLRLMPVQVPSPRWLAAVKIAAAAALLVGGGVLGGRAISRSAESMGAPAQAVPIAVSTARGERRVLRLSDGTVVTLAPASTLRWSPNYGARDRVVELDGEAVFTVTHDAARPFAVRTPHALARDLGTRFAIRAYPGDAVTDVTVAEGAVAVGDEAAGSRSIVLHRGDRARVRSVGIVELSRDVPLDDYFAWTAGRLVFRDVPLREAAVQLGRWYDIDVRYDTDAIGSRRLSASFEDEPGPEAVRVVAAILNLRVARAGHVYTLQAK